jgi:hypothetical protein
VRVVEETLQIPDEIAASFQNGCIITGAWAFIGWCGMATSRKAGRM